MEIKYNMYLISLSKITWNCFALLLTSTKKKRKCIWELLFLELILKTSRFLFKKGFVSVALVAFSNFFELPILLYCIGHLYEAGTYYNLYGFMWALVKNSIAKI